MGRRRSCVRCALALAWVLWPGRALAIDADTCASAAESAEDLRAAGKLRDARAQLVVCAQQGCPAVVRADCQKWLTEVAGAMPSIVVRARDAAGADVADASVSIDGTTVAPQYDGKPIEIDPGRHTLRCARPGGASADASIVAVAGEKLRAVDVRFAAPPAPIERRPPAPADVPAAPSRPVPTSAWVAGGAGIAALAVGAVTGVLAMDRASTVRTHCDAQYACDAQGLDAASDGQWMAPTSTVAIGAGAVLVGVAVYLWATAEPAASRDAARAPWIVSF